MFTLSARKVRLSSGWSQRLNSQGIMGLSRRQLKEAEEIVEEHQNEFRAAWHQHFGS